ncbi:uncharacterized protein A4U43_C10F1990 [Asparagus officinalis]|uniref:C2H2-type domain-containing protein n=1 Tax=Asparagus officinalis TaxID=4686 RepID=A0A5P1E087_ASPOF|nr:zinc finger protein ZAT6-like [Asparagus officinalis]ONK55888.1 uncharacterized protein A4U43_C10F1990 [Asparagus officinalis]
MKLDGSRAYVCGTCKKSFASHQALGGHAASHNKEKNKKGEEDGNGPNKDRKKSGDGDHEKEHVCETCLMSFATGQALGGHMRKHFDPTKLKKPKREAEQVGGMSEDTGGNLDELPLTNSMEEADRVQTVTEENGGAFGDFQNVNGEETDDNSGESRPAGNLTGLPHVFDLNELALMCDEEMQDSGI